MSQADWCFIAIRQAPGGRLSRPRISPSSPTISLQQRQRPAAPRTGRSRIADAPRRQQRTAARRSPSSPVRAKNARLKSDRAQPAHGVIARGNHCRLAVRAAVAGLRRTVGASARRISDRATAVRRRPQPDGEEFVVFADRQPRRADASRRARLARLRAVGENRRRRRSRRRGIARRNSSRLRGMWYQLVTRRRLR